MTSIQRIPTARSYSAAVVAGSQIYMGLYRGCGDSFPEQFEATMMNIKRTLAQLNLTVENCVKVNVWLKNIADLPLMEKLFFGHFDPDKFPARMTSTTEFIDADCLLMIEGIASITD